MQTLFAIATTVSMITLIACPDRDAIAPELTGRGTSEQLSGNTLWHLAAIPGTAQAYGDRPLWLD